MTDVNVALQAVVDSIASKAATAAPNDLAYLGKALEAVAPGSQTSLIVQIGGAQVEAVETAGAAQVAAVNTAGTAKTNQVNTAGDAKIAAVNAAGDSKVSEINAAVLGGTATLVQFTTSALVVSLPNTVRPTVYVKADPILAMSQVSLCLPASSAVAQIEIEIRNTSWSVVILRNSANTGTFGYIPPQSKRVIRTLSVGTDSWVIEPISLPTLRPDCRTQLVFGSSVYSLALPGLWGSTTIPATNPLYSLSGTTYYAESASYHYPFGVSLVCDGGGNPHSLFALREFWNTTPNDSFLAWTRKEVFNSNDSMFSSMGSLTGYDSKLMASGHNITSMSYQALSSGWRTLAVAAAYHSSTKANAGVNLYVADAVLNKNRGVRVVDAQANGEICLMPFADDRTFVVIVPTTSGRSVYRYQVDVNGNLTAKGTASFSTNASFVKISSFHMLVIDGGASGVYWMGSTENVMPLSASLPSSVYSLCGVNAAYGVHLSEYVAALGNATFVMALDKSVTGRTNNYAGFGTKNRKHVGGGVFVEDDPSFGTQAGSAKISVIEGGVGNWVSANAQGGLVIYNDSGVRFYFAAHSEGIAALAFSDESNLRTITSTTRWDMSLNCLVRDQ